MKAPYKHRPLLLLDEIPELGIFEQAIAYFGGWNIKAYLMCQDKAQLDVVYGKNESIAYALNKGVTTVIKEQESISFPGGT